MVLFFFWDIRGENKGSGLGLLVIFFFRKAIFVHFGTVFLIPLCLTFLTMFFGAKFALQCFDIPLIYFVIFRLRFLREIHDGRQTCNDSAVPGLVDALRKRFYSLFLGFPCVVSEFCEITFFQTREFFVRFFS